MTDLKRLTRYLIRYPDFAQVFKAQKIPERLVIQVDSDHAGDTVTRKSTTGMIAFYGQHVLKHSSNVQSTIALSTGESEYYALVKGGSTGLGIQSLLADYGINAAVTIESDSNAAKGKRYSQPCWTWQSTPYPNPLLVAARTSSRKPP